MPEPAKRKRTSKKKTSAGPRRSTSSAGKGASAKRKRSTKKKTTTRKTASSTEAGAREAPGAEAEEPSLWGRADQLGAILAKGLDMAEAGLSLGLTVINRVGTAAQEQVFDRFTVRSGGGGHAEPAPEAAPPPHREYDESTGRGAPEVTVPEDDRYCVTNRLPLSPGGEGKVSFSINNDSMAEPKRVSLALDGFLGESGGAVMNAECFSVKPARKTIAPMDFEKFVLEGVVPETLPPDIYRGSVVVSSGSEFRIPVRLVVLTP